MSVSVVIPNHNHGETLELAIEFIADDELVEITPKSVRLRKRFLKEHERKRAGR